MGANFDHIDGVFRSKLGDYSQSAPEDVWGNIEGALKAKQVNKRFTYYKIAAAIAAFAIIGSTYLYLNNKKMVLTENPVIAQDNVIKDEQDKETVSDQGSDEVVATPSQKDNKAQNNQIETIIAKAEPVKLESEGSDVEVVLNNKITSDTEVRDERISKIDQKEIAIDFEKNEPTLIDIRKKKVETILNTLPDIYNSFVLNDAIETNNKEKNKWSMGGEFSPLYSYRHVTETGGVNSKEYYNSSENAIMSYTGGLNVQYKAIDRLTIQAGVYYTTMGQSFDYISVYANAAYDMVAEQYKDRFINAYNISNSLGEVSFNSPYVVIDARLGRVDNLTDSKGKVNVSDPAFTNLDAEIQQSFKYVEVPFLLRYKLIDKNIDLNVIGGVGANFLIGNDVYLKYGGNKEIIGETAGVNSVNYNGTFGLGIEYPLMNRLNLRLEPSIKYYINEINSSSTVESHPYSIGIYTGINYSF